MDEYYSLLFKNYFSTIFLNFYNLIINKHYNRKFISICKPSLQAYTCTLLFTLFDLGGNKP